jgi:hypothetical protein
VPVEGVVMLAGKIPIQSSLFPGPPLKVAVIGLPAGYELALRVIDLGAAERVAQQTIENRTPGTRVLIMAYYIPPIR